MDRNAVLMGPAVIDETTVNLVLDLALRIGELQLAGGAGAADVTATMQAVTRAYGLPQCDVDVISPRPASAWHWRRVVCSASSSLSRCVKD